jgi:N-methylhydantoinase A
VLSAAGLLRAPIEHEVSVAYPRQLAGAAWDDVRSVLARLDKICAGLIRAEAVDPERAAVRHAADVCYIGQGYHLEITLHDDDADPLRRLYRDFLAAHDRVYGHATEAPARFVNLRSVHRVDVAEAGSAPLPISGDGEPKGRRPILTDAAAGFETAAIYDRAGLDAGAVFDGPAIVEQADTTTVIPRGWRGRMHAGGGLLLEPVLA